MFRCFDVPEELPGPKNRLQIHQIQRIRKGEETRKHTTHLPPKAIEGKETGRLSEPLSL